jgi:hypothetical protein
MSLLFFHLSGIINTSFGSRMKCNFFHPAFYIFNVPDSSTVEVT